MRRRRGPKRSVPVDVVYGSRFMSNRPHRVLYFWYSVGNKVLTTLSNAFTNLNLTDMETWRDGFQALRCIVRYSPVWDKVTGRSPANFEHRRSRRKSFVLTTGK